MPTNTVRRRLVTIGLASTLLALAACGGGSSGTAAGGSPEPTTTQAEPRTTEQPTTSRRSTTTQPATTTTTLPPGPETTRSRWFSFEFTDDPGWTYRGRVRAVVPGIELLKETSSSPPGKARVVIRFDEFTELPEADLPTDNGDRQGDPATVDTSFQLLYPADIPYMTSDLCYTEHEGLRCVLDEESSLAVNTTFDMPEEEVDRIISQVNGVEPYVWLTFRSNYGVSFCGLKFRMDSLDLVPEGTTCEGAVISE